MGRGNEESPVAELAVTEGAIERDDSFGDPEREHVQRLFLIAHHQARGREYSRTDHVGDDNISQGKKAELALERVRIPQRLYFVSPPRSSISVNLTYLD
jgi:hypothetical protein